MTVVGTRPELIRLCKIIRLLDDVGEHTLVHTGQNYDSNLSEIFFRDLGIRQPDYSLNARGNFSEQIASMFPQIDDLIRKIKPNRFLVLGDTNSALSAIIAKRAGVPVFHMEAGNRCFSDIVPEETNRRLVDHSSDVLLPYTERSRQHLIDEGIARNRIYVTGNPIGEILHTFSSQIEQSQILSTLGLSSQKYILATMHRSENVDIKERISSLIEGFELVSQKFNVPIIISTHPRTEAKLAEHGIKVDSNKLKFLKPFGFFDFVALQRAAKCVISDSGTAQEECSILKIPSVTIRDVTERPETIECGSNIISGVRSKDLVRCVTIVLSFPPNWEAPKEYQVGNVSETVVKIIGSAHIMD